MSKDLIIALLSLVAIGSLAAVFILWAKLDEQKKCSADKSKLFNQQDAFILELITKQEKMQDKLSSVLCPTNNHVWKDGECVKCGRAKDG